jgi:hypothetical protein
MMNKKLKIYSIALSLVVLSIAGLAFAHWTKVITVTGKVTTGTVCWEWSDRHPPSYVDTSPGVNPYLGDWLVNQTDWSLDQYNPKDIASGIVTQTDDIVEVNITNAYPGYAAQVSTHVHYCGTVPGIVKNILVYNSTMDLVETIDGSGMWFIEYSEGVTPFVIDWLEDPKQLEYCETWEASFYIYFLEALEQDCLSCDTDPNYTLYLVYEVINYNEYDNLHPEDPYPVPK